MEAPKGKSQSIKYKYQKLTSESNEKEIQINKFRYRFDINNNLVLQFIGMPGSGSTSDDKNRFAQLMKQDRIECVSMEKKEFLMNKFGIGKGSRTKTKKFLDK